MHRRSQHDIKCFKIIVKILNSPPNTIFPAITVNYRATYLPSLTSWVSLWAWINIQQAGVHYKCPLSRDSKCRGQVSSWRKSCPDPWRVTWSPSHTEPRSWVWFWGRSLATLLPSVSSVQVSVHLLQLCSILTLHQQSAAKLNAARMELWKLSSLCTNT